MGEDYCRKRLDVVDRDHQAGRGSVMMNMGGEGDEMCGKTERDKVLVRGRIGL